MTLPLRTITLLALLLTPLQLAWAQSVADDEPGEEQTTTLTADSTDLPTPATRLPLDELRRFTDAFEHIRRSYVEEVSDSQLLDYAISGMVGRLDPHSNYLEPAELDELTEAATGEFGGLGLELGTDRGFVRVISQIDDTPAYHAGIEAGDYIMKLDGESVQGWSLTQVVNKMRGDKGTSINIEIMREGLDQPLQITLVRDIITVHSVRSRVLEPGYGYLRIAQFQGSTAEQLLTNIDQLEQKLQQQGSTLQGLILDLRNNPGGLLQAAVDVSDAFLDDGIVVYTQGRHEKSKAVFVATEGDRLNGAPLAVLINGGSASASEIVAGALQDHKRAIIMGTTSFGKGSVQQVIPLTDERAIKITTALYYTPNDRSIQAEGIEPDIVVERAKVETLGSGLNMNEASLKGHLQNAHGNADKANTNKTPAPKAGTTPAAAESQSLQARDNQLYEALTVLKGVNILRGD